MAANLSVRAVSRPYRFLRGWRAWLATSGAACLPRSTATPLHKFFLRQAAEGDRPARHRHPRDAELPLVPRFAVQMVNRSGSQLGESVIAASSPARYQGYVRTLGDPGAQQSRCRYRIELDSPCTRSSGLRHANRAPPSRAPETANQGSVPSARTAIVVSGHTRRFLLVCGVPAVTQSPPSLTPR